MVDWVQENVSSQDPFILEVGSGNGALLFALQEAGYNAAHICGVDYSEDAVRLAKAVGSTRGERAEKVTFGVCDFLKDFPPPLSPSQTSGNDGDGVNGVNAWDLVLDKGTFDAMALAERDDDGKSPSDDYPPRIAQILKPDGLFLITSCNFTEEELKDKFANIVTGLEYYSRIQFPAFSFGGRSGTMYSSVAFRKPS